MFQIYILLSALLYCILQIHKSIHMNLIKLYTIYYLSGMNRAK